MKTMEQELRQMNQNLYELYIRSYDLAVEQWLPQIKPSNDSYNSLPHLLGVKKRIERILYPEERDSSITLSACELYILLNSVLFHDIGKGIDGEVELSKRDDKPTVYPDHKEDILNSALIENAAISDKKAVVENHLKCTSVHGYISKRTVKNFWAELGIVSERVAQLIGDVCQYHDTYSKDEKLPGILYIDEYGPVRVSIIGALLVLGDLLDDTYTRITPKYMKVSGVLAQVGKFRSKIRSTWIDPIRRFACTEIDDTALTLDDLKNPNAAQINGNEVVANPLRDYIYWKLTIKPKKIEYNHGNIVVEEEYNRLKEGFDGDYKDTSILYSTLGNTCENSYNLNRIKNELYIIGMPIKEWLIEYDGHLFGVDYKLLEYSDQYRLLHCRDSTKNDEANIQDGLEDKEFNYKRYKIFPTGTHFSLESLIDLNYCNKILRAIYMLAGGVLGKPYHDYFDLLNYIFEDESNLTKVKCTVARLSKLLTLYHPTQNKEGAILYYDDAVWMFFLDNTGPTTLSDLRAFLKNILQL